MLFSSNFMRILLGCAIGAALSFPALSTAQIAGPDRVNNFIQGGHSGTWYDPANPGHGLFVEVLDKPIVATGKEMLVAWFAFFDGNPIWLLAQGDVVADGEGFRAVLKVLIFEGNDFPPRFDPNMSSMEEWGEMVLSFTGCDLAHLSWDSDIAAYGEGDLDLIRLTNVADSVCFPDLAGDPKTDDHGNSWTTGTYLSDIGVETRKLPSELEKAGDVDVFVFTVANSVEFSAYTLSERDTDTMAVLYEIVDYREIEVARNDDGGLFKGFQIEKYLFPGTYSLHVSGKDDEVGDYDLYYRAFWD
jgi:hypothetical protein